MTDCAFTLAAIRAAGPRRLSDTQLEAAELAASRIGRRLVDVFDADEQRLFTSGYLDGSEPPTDSDGLEFWRLSPVPLLTLAACLGLCWRDRGDDPYPGEPTTVEEVLDVVAAIGADRRWALGALRNDLLLAWLVTLRGQEVTLGPAVAAWPPSQVGALRRFATLLPGTKSTGGSL